MNLELIRSNVSDSYIGFIQYNKGEISNLKIIDLKYETTRRRNNLTAFTTFCGGLVGKNQGIIKNSYVQGTICVSDYNIYVGGLTGFTTGGSVINCGTNIDLQATIINSNGSSFNDGHIGGLAGYSNGSSTIIENSYSINNIVSNNLRFIGGLVGNVNGTNLKYCFANSNIKASYYYSVGVSIGGLCGGASAEVNYCYSEGSINLNSNAQSIVGGLLGSASGTIRTSYSTVNINVDINSSSNSSSNAYCGGLLGSYYRNTGEYVYHSFADNKINVKSIYQTYVGAITGINLLSSNPFVNCKYNNENSITGSIIDLHGEGVSKETLQNKSMLSKLNFCDYVSSEDLLLNPKNAWIYQDSFYPKLFFEHNYLGS